MDHAALTKLTHGKNLSSRMIRWALMLTEFNVEWEHHQGAQNVVADVLSRNPIETIVRENIACAVIRDLVLSTREQLISEQRQRTLSLVISIDILKTLMIVWLMRQSVGTGLEILS
ncbi:hypothetical protein TNCV_2517001 [Trichonephila clavipes]|nr:hypothetical protein TNCV_2517001 [Trichonephila clavipes]